MPIAAPASAVGTVWSPEPVLSMTVVDRGMIGSACAGDAVRSASRASGDRRSCWVAAGALAGTARASAHAGSRRILSLRNHLACFVLIALKSGQ